MTETLESIERTRNAIGKRIGEIDKEAGAARLAGDQASITRLRKEKDNAQREADEWDAAAKLLERRQAEEKERARQAGLAKARVRARQVAGQLTEAARKVDEALAVVEGAMADYRLKELDLSRALAAAGLSDGGRIRRQLKQAMRWATWKSAPVYAETAEVPRAEAHRRETFEALTGRVVPNIPKE